ncbi:unnamed protein product [Closterium sp. Yama58-4]|nr:unnamed protein product [Closterium sp. Yama58-4]
MEGEKAPLLPMQAAAAAAAAGEEEEAEDEVEAMTVEAEEGDEAVSPAAAATAVAAREGMRGSSSSRRKYVDLRMEAAAGRAEFVAAMDNWMALTESSKWKLKKAATEALRWRHLHHGVGALDCIRQAVVQVRSAILLCRCVRLAKAEMKGCSAREDALAKACRAAGAAGIFAAAVEEEVEELEPERDEEGWGVQWIEADEVVRYMPEDDLEDDLAGVSEKLLAWVAVPQAEAREVLQALMEVLLLEMEDLGARFEINDPAQTHPAILPGLAIVPALPAVPGAAAGGLVTAAAGAGAAAAVPGQAVQGAAEGEAAEGAAAEGAAAEGAAAEGAAAERTAAEGAAAERTAAEGTAAERTAAEGTAAERTAAEGTAAERTAAEGTAAERTAAEGTAAERTAAEGTAAERTAAEGTAAERTAAEGTAAERTAAEGTAAERTAAQEPRSKGGEARGAVGEDVRAAGASEQLPRAKQLGDRSAARLPPQGSAPPKKSTASKTSTLATPVEVVCPPLESLTLDTIRFVSTCDPDGLPSLPSASPLMCPSPPTTRFPSLPSSSSPFSTIPRMSGEPRSFESLARAAVCRRLKSLALLNCCGLEEGQLVQLLRACVMLEDLKVEGCDGFSDSVIAGSQMEVLTRLRVVGCGGIMSE